MATADLEGVLAQIWAGSPADSLESDVLDFKQPSRAIGETLRSLLEAAICFANTNGGQIVLGIADRPGGPEAFAGAGAIEPESVRHHIFSNTEPSLTVNAHRIDSHGCGLLLVEVPMSTDVHADKRGRATQRVKTECLPLTPNDHARLRELRQGSDWSTREGPKVAIDAKALEAVRRRLSASVKPERRGLARLSDEDLQRALGAVTDRDALNNAGAVAIGVEGVRFTYTYRDSPGGEPVAVEKYVGPLLLAYEELIKRIAVRRRLVPLTLPDGQQLQIEDFPTLAVREALTNAFIHREYFTDLPVVVEHSPQILSISSPGGLVQGITASNILTHPSKPRNPQLAHITSLVELSEEVGRGVDRMYREMVRSGRGLPEIVEVDDYTRVSLIGGAPDVNIARYVAQLPQDVREDTDALLTILVLCSRRSTTAAAMAPLLQKSEAETAASLGHLASDHVGLLEAVSSNPRARKLSYRLRAEAVKGLGTALTYTRQSSTEVDAKIIAHVREYERITNATVQNLLTVKMSRANTIIRDLRNRKILEKIGEAERGPSVAYGPGPAFPPKPARRRRKESTDSEDPSNDQPLPGL